MPKELTFEEALGGQQGSSTKEFSYLESFGPVGLQRPQLSPEATLPEYLAQPGIPDYLMEPEGRVPYTLGKQAPLNIPGYEQTYEIPEVKLPKEFGGAEATALGFGAGFLQRAAPMAERMAGVLSEIAPSRTQFAPFEPGSLAEQEERKRVMRTPGEFARDVSESPIVRNAQDVQSYWEKMIPRKDEEKEYWLAKGAEEATAMIPYFLAGTAAPLVIGAESFSQHIVDDYENLKQNLGEEKAGEVAIGNAFASGALQAAVFKYLPKPLRAAGERWILNKFGRDVLSEFVGKRLASTAQTAALFGTAAEAEQVATGQAPSVEAGVGGATAGAIFGALSPYGQRETARPRGIETVLATSEARAARLSRMMQEGPREFGFKWQSVPGDIPNRPGVVAHTLKDGTVIVSEKNFQTQMEERMARGETEAEAIRSIISEESLHGVLETAEGGDEIARNYTQDLTESEKSIIARRIQGPGAKTKLSDAQLGKEAIRFAMQQLQGVKPGEHIFAGSRGEVLLSKLLTGLEKVIQWVREHVGKKFGPTEARARQLASLEQLQQRANELRKGIQDARKDKTTAEVYGYVRTLQAPTGQLPVAQGGPGVQPQAEGRLAQAAQIPLTPQAGRGMATIKNPPVVKDVPPGSIHPDSIVSAIRLINGDVVHGWIKKNGKAATHPEIAKRYGITVEELDRKGWVSKDGKAFYEREPAAKGTLLPTEKKEGELHSTDKPEEAPPVAPTKGAQPVQATTGLATTPPVELTTPAGGPAAKPKLARPVEKVNIPGFSDAKLSRLEELNQKITSPGAKINQAEYTEWMQLSDELAKAEAAAGLAPAPQGQEEPPAMSIKASGMTQDERMDLARRAVNMTGEEFLELRPFNDINLPLGTEATPAQLSELKSLHAKALARHRGLMDTARDAIKMMEDDKSTESQKKSAQEKYDQAVKDLGPIGSLPQFYAEAIARAEGRDKGQPGAPPSMAIKGGVPPEDLEQLATRVIAAVGGVGQDPGKIKAVQQVVSQIAKLPKEQWGDALTQFQSNIQEAEIIESNRKMSELVARAEALTQAMSPENLAKIFTPVDRAGAYRSALYVLNKPPVPRPIVKKIPEGKTPEQIAATGKVSRMGLVMPESKAVRPKYNVGDYKEFWEGFHERHPNVPEWVAQEVFNNALDDFLNNASGETLRALLRPARLERKYMGERTAKVDPATGELDISMLPKIPDPDPNPIIADIIKSPSPEQSVKFKAFMASRDMTVEQGIAELDRLREMEAAETADLARRQPQEAGMAFVGGEWRKVTPEEYQAYLARGGKAQVQKGKKGEGVFRPGTREPEPLTKQDLRLLESDRKKGRIILAKRRQKIVSDLKKFFMKDVEVANQNPMRRKVTLDDIKFEAKAPSVAYAEYDAAQAGNMDFLKKVLGRQPKIGMSVTVVRDPKTGDYHAVSSHVRGEDPRFFDPAGLPGSKIGNYIGLHNLTSKWSVVGHFLVRDPLYNFHQVWRTDKTSTGKEKFDAEIGEVARKRENSNQEEYQKFIQESRAELAAEKARRHRERFFGGVREEEVTGEEAEKPPTTAEEESAAEGEEPTTSREEETPLSIRERLAREREAAGAKPWETAEDVRDVDVGLHGATEAAMQTWYAGKGKGAQMQGTMQTDLSHLAQEPLVRAEAESLYDVYRELKISNPFQWFAMIEEAQRKLNEGVPVAEQKIAGIADVLRLRNKDLRLSSRDVAAMYAMDKIANRIYQRMAESPVEKAKVKGLPPIPEDRQYRDMSPEEKQHYDEVENLKYRSLIQAFTRIYELTKEATESGPLAEKAAAKGVTVPEDVIRFADRAVDQYGPSARRELEFAAFSALRAPEISGARTLLAGSKFGGTPRTLVPRVLPGVPRGTTEPRMLTASEQMLVTGKAQEGIKQLQKPFTTAFTSPVAQAGEVVPERPMGEYLRKTYAAQQREPFIPSELDPEEALRYRLKEIMRKRTGEEPPAMTLKGVGPSRAAREELRAQGRTSWEYQAPPQIKKEDLIAGGRELVISGAINPEKEMRQFEIKNAEKPGSGYISLDGALAFRYWDYRLQQWADSIANDPQYGPKSPDYKAAEKLSADWKRRMEPAVSQMFARLGHSLQGWNQIGPDDMRSTTFVRRFLKKVKSAAEGKDEEEYELTEDDEAAVQQIVKDVEGKSQATHQLSMLVGDALTKVQDVDLDPGQKQLMTQFEQAMKAVRGSASSNLRQKKPPAAMAMKGGELPELDPKTMDELGGIGADVMAELSKAGNMTDKGWLEEMKKVLSSPEVDRPDLEPYLPKARAVAEEIRETALNNYIGTGDPVKDARNIFKRKRPPLEESLAAIHRALLADPTGEKITPAEAYHVWNYLKTRFFDEGVRDFQVIRQKGSAELGIKDSQLGITKVPYPELRLFRAISTNRTMRKLSSDLIKAMREEAMVKAQAMNWLKNQQYPGWLKTARLLPRFFFWDKVLGHGFVPMITHASPLLFNPYHWSEYFGTYRNGKWTPGAWQEMYRMAIGTKPISRLLSKVGAAKWEGETGKEYHRRRTQELVLSERFYDWKRAGLQVDPFKYTDDYQIQRLQRIFGSKLEAWTGGRGFDALKTLRYAMAEKWYRGLPEHMQNRRSMELIADSVNHVTGIVKTKFHEAANWALFAPKLEASRWAYIFKDTAKALDIVRKGNRASLEQRAWAVREMKQKAAVVAWYAAMLGVNQAMLWMLGSDKKINMTDPKKPDFLQFKAAGFRIGVTSPFVGMIRLFANTLHAAAGERTKFEKLTSRQRQVGETLWSYGRGKMSPFASFATDIATQEDFARRKLPWSSERPTRRELLTGRGPYETPEYLLQTFAPIPIEEAVKESFRSQGMSESEAVRWLRILTIAGGMGATGARIADEQLEQ